MIWKYFWGLIYFSRIKLIYKKLIYSSLCLNSSLSRISFKINLSFINIIEKQNTNYKLNRDSSARLLYAARWSKYWIYCNQDIIKWKLILLSVHLVFADNSIDETAATWLGRPPNTHTYLIMRSYFSPLQSDRACIVSYTCIHWG